MIKFELQMAMFEIFQELANTSVSDNQAELQSVHRLMIELCKVVSGLIKTLPDEE